MSTMTSTEARAALPELLDRVVAGEEVTITRHGEPVAVVVRPDALRVRRAQAAMAVVDKVRETLAAGRASSLSSVATLTADQADALIHEVRAAREAR